MNASKLVPPSRHVASLAVLPFPGLGAGLPFPIGVFQEFAVDGIALGRELVTGGAEY